MQQATERVRVLTNTRDAEQPLDGIGSVIYCEDCYPMLRAPERNYSLTDELGLHPVGEAIQFHQGHYRRGFPNTPKGTDIFEGSTRLEHVEEAVKLPGVPGLLLREYVTDADGKIVLCRRNGHTTMMRRIRYAPHALLVTEGASW